MHILRKIGKQKYYTKTTEVVMASIGGGNFWNEFENYSSGIKRLV